MRIAVNGWFAGSLATGSGQYLDALLQRLPRAGGQHEWILVTPSEPQAEAPPPWRPVTAEAPPLRLGSDLAKLWFEQVGFPRACRKAAADVAFVPYWGSPWRSPCPVVVTVHDLIPLLLPQYRGGPLQRAYTALVARTARRAAAVLTDSQASRDDIITHLGIPAGRVHAVHLAAGERYAPVKDPAELARVRGRYGLPEGPFLLYLGGFDVRKNVERTLQAFGRAGEALAAAGRPAPLLVVAGKLPDADTPFTPDPRRIADGLGIGARVRWTGPVEEADKPALYTLATGFVFASVYEGFGLPVLEAMACANCFAVRDPVQRNVVQ
jgi:glycosyltransferase involved in cell wall biosynthesis